MAARPARKRIHYLRAVFAPGARGNDRLESMIGRALRSMPAMADTEVPIPVLGVVAVRHRNLGRRRVKLAIGAGAPGESMSTMGLQVRQATDAERASTPPANRAFKTSDAFCLISNDDLLLIVEGMRTNAVESYLRALIQRSGQPASHSAFEFRPVGDQEQQEILESEGVKELRLSGTAYQAQHELAREEYGSGSAGVIEQLWEEVKDRVRSLLAGQVNNERELAVLADNWANLNITTVVKAARGVYAEPVILDAMENAGLELIDERPDNVDVTIVTKNNSVIAGSSLILGKYVNLTRQNDRNDLSYIDVWAALEEYLTELIEQHRWAG